MTHDELLAKIDGFSCCSGAHELALRAVVELHRPIKRPKWLPIEFQGYSCNLCPGSYPCPTIKAIEKELG
jgi:hypothetical protein